MAKQEPVIFKQVEQIFRQTFEDDNLTITRNTTVKDIDQWDSLRNVMLVDALEKHFQIQFELEEIMNFDSVGTICDYIKSKYE